MPSPEGRQVATQATLCIAVPPPLGKNCGSERRREKEDKLLVCDVTDAGSRFQGHEGDPLSRETGAWRHAWRERNYQPRSVDKPASHLRQCFEQLRTCAALTEARTKLQSHVQCWSLRSGWHLIPPCRPSAARRGSGDRQKTGVIGQRCQVRRDLNTK